MKKWLAILLCMIMIVSLLPAAPVHADGVDYYLVGDFNNWMVSAEYKLSPTPGKEGEYSVTTDLTSANEIKIKDSNNNWYGEFGSSSGGNVAVSHQISPQYGDPINIVGDRTVYFKPNEYLSVGTVLDGNYLVGNMTNWSLDNSYRFTNTIEGIYYIDKTLVSSVPGQSDGIKIINVYYGSPNWFGGENYNPSIDGSARIYFRPGWDGDTSQGWHNSYIKAVPAAEAVNDGKYYLVGTMNNNGWTLDSAYCFTQDPSNTNIYTLENVSITNDCVYKVALSLGGLKEAHYPSGDNLSLNAGTYNFTFNASTHTVSATSIPTPAARYTVTTSAVNGSVSVSATTLNQGTNEVDEGDTVTITTTANPGYVISSVTVMQGQTPVAVSNNQFTMPAGNVTVTATFTLIPADNVSVTLKPGTAGGEARTYTYDGVQDEWGAGNFHWEDNHTTLHFQLDNIFSAPEGKEFAGWLDESDNTTVYPELCQNIELAGTTSAASRSFVAQWVTPVTPGFSISFPTSITLDPTQNIQSFALNYSDIIFNSSLDEIWAEAVVSLYNTIELTNGNDGSKVTAYFELSDAYPRESVSESYGSYISFGAGSNTIYNAGSATATVTLWIYLPPAQLASKAPGTYSGTFSYDTYLENRGTNELQGSIPVSLVIPYPSHNIMTSSTHGSISVAASAEEGSTVNLSFTPDANYRFHSATYSYNNGSKTITENITAADGATVASFTMPAYDVTVSAVFWPDDTNDAAKYYLVTSDNPTATDEAKRFRRMDSDGEATWGAPYLLEKQAIPKNTLVRVIKVEGGDTTAYPASGYFEVGEDYYSNSNNINVRFDPVGRSQDASPLHWPAFGGYFAWEPFYTVNVWVSPQHAVTVNNTNGTITFSTESGLVYSAHAGETVTLSVTPGNSYTFASWDVKDASNNPVAVTNDTFTMPDSAVTISANYTSNDTPILKSVNLSDYGRIGVTFKLTLPAGLEASEVTAELTVGDTTTSTLLSTLTPSNGVYSISTWLPARQMDTQITIKTKVGGAYKMQGTDGTDLTAGYETSISACCDIYASSSNQTLAALATAMKTYGAYAYAYLDGAALAANTPALNVADNVFDIFDITKPESLPAGLTLKSMFLTLDESTSINLRFTIADGYSFDNYANTSGLFKYGTTVLNPVQDGDTLLITIPDIKASRLNDDCTVTVKLQGDETSVITCSALYYGKLAMGTNKDALKNAVKALYAYNQAAEAYFGP